MRKMESESQKFKLYVRKRFGSKRNLMSSFEKKTKLRLSGWRNYEGLFNEICENIGKEKLLSILNVRSMEEAELRALLFDALYKGLLEAVWAHHFVMLYEEITGHEIRIKYKGEKKKPSRRLAFNVKLERFRKAWVSLVKKEVTFPLLLQYENIVVGPLGLLKSLTRRKVYRANIDRIIGRKFKKNSQLIILNALLGLIAKVSENPANFGLSKKWGERMSASLGHMTLEKDEFIKSTIGLQIVYAYLDDESISSVINALIARGEIEPLKVRRYERFPFSFSDWVITPYGIFKQRPSWERKPNRELAEALIEEVERKILEPSLDQYRGSYPLKVQQYCLKENPECIMRKWFGRKDLLKIAEKLGIVSPSRIKEEEDLILLILLKFGFDLPTIVEQKGITGYRSFLIGSARKLQRDRRPKDVAVDLYGETERILRDITYFYLKFLWPKVDDVNILVRERVGLRYKSFEELGLGHFINILRTLNSKIRKNKKLRERMSRTFGRMKCVMREQMEILDEVSPVLSPIKHTGKGITRKECLGVIKKLQKLAKQLQESRIYPTLLRVELSVTNEYGMGYYEGIDEEGQVWTIEFKGLNPGRAYFMHSETSPVAVNPVMVEKIL